MNIDEIEQELGVMQLSDSFFPTGIFATSNGLEFLFTEKKIKGMIDLIEMIRINIIQQIGPSDCVALANAFDSEGKKLPTKIANFWVKINGKGEIVWQHTTYADGDEEELYEIVKKVAAGKSIE